jgi:hypothetical protein
MPWAARKSNSLAYAAGHLGGELRKLCAFGLPDVEHIGGAEPDEDRLWLLFFALLLALALACAQHRGEDADAFLAFLHPAPQLVPGVHASHARSLRTLPCDLEDVAEGVAVKAPHGGQIACEGFGVPGLELLDQQLHVRGDDLVRGLWSRLGRELLDSCGAHGGLLLGSGFGFSAWTRGIHMPNATWRRRG